LSQLNAGCQIWRDIRASLHLAGKVPAHANRNGVARQVGSALSGVDQELEFQAWEESLDGLPSSGIAGGSALFEEICRTGCYRFYSIDRLTLGLRLERVRPTLAPTLVTAIGESRGNIDHA
jgi:hypothetical protein